MERQELGEMGEDDPFVNMFGANQERLGQNMTFAEFTNIINGRMQNSRPDGPEGVSRSTFNKLP